MSNVASPFVQGSGKGVQACIQRSVGAALDLVKADGNRYYACQKCGRPLSSADQDPKTGTLAREINFEVLSHWNRFGDSREIIVREFCCPHCAHMIAVEVRKAGDPVLYDTELFDLQRHSLLCWLRRSHVLRFHAGQADRLPVATTPKRWNACGGRWSSSLSPASARP